MQAEQVGMSNDRWFLTEMKKFLIGVVTVHNTIVGNNMLYWSCGASIQGSMANVPTVSVCLLCLSSHNLCSKFVHTGLAAHYLSKASPCSADRPYIPTHL